VVRSIEAILREVGNLKRIGDEYAKQDAGTLSIATTHHQARYALPGPIAQMRKRFPKVSIALHQGTPDEVARLVRHEEADVGIATESLETVPDLVTLPCYEWQHVLVVPAGHPLTAVERPTLEQLAAEPLVTYHFAFAGRRRIDAAFQRAGLAPQIALEAIDADVIKTYVRLGLGVGIVAEAAMREESVAGGGTGELVARPLGHLFGSNTTRIAFRKGAYLRNYVYAFAELTSDRLTRALVQRALAGDTSDWVD
jgi:LysR family cys regulon transcriptional activator